MNVHVVSGLDFHHLAGRHPRLRHGVTHDVLACWFGMSRSTITRAVGEVRPLLAERGCTVEGGIRLHTLADEVAHLGASRQLGLLMPPRCG